MRLLARSSTVPRLLAAMAVWLVAVSLASCAGRRPAEEGPSRRPSPAIPAAVPTPAPTPAPTPTPTPVPPAIACVSAADCALTPYSRHVASTTGCYCPACPQPRNAAVAAANEESWQRLCGAAWAERAGCQAPMCQRPIGPACTGGACLPAVSDSLAGAPPG